MVEAGDDGTVSEHALDTVREEFVYIANSLETRQVGQDTQTETAALSGIAGSISIIEATYEGTYTKTQPGEWIEVGKRTVEQSYRDSTKATQVVHIAESTGVETTFRAEVATADELHHRTEEDYADHLYALAHTEMRTSGVSQSTVSFLRDEPPADGTTIQTGGSSQNVVRTGAAFAGEPAPGGTCPLDEEGYYSTYEVVESVDELFRRIETETVDDRGTPEDDSDDLTETTRTLRRIRTAGRDSTTYDGDYSITDGAFDQEAKVFHDTVRERTHTALRERTQVHATDANFHEYESSRVTSRLVDEVHKEGLFEDFETTWLREHAIAEEIDRVRRDKTRTESDTFDTGSATESGVLATRESYDSERATRARESVVRLADGRGRTAASVENWWEYDSLTRTVFRRSSDNEILLDQTGEGKGSAYAVESIHEIDGTGDYSNKATLDYRLREWTKPEESAPGSSFYSEETKETRCNSRVRESFAYATAGPVSNHRMAGAMSSSTTEESTTTTITPDVYHITSARETQGHSLVSTRSPERARESVSPVLLSTGSKGDDDVDTTVKTTETWMSSGEESNVSITYVSDGYLLNEWSGNIQYFVDEGMFSVYENSSFSPGKWKIVHVVDSSNGGELISTVIEESASDRYVDTSRLFGEPEGRARYYESVTMPGSEFGSAAALTTVGYWERHCIGCSGTVLEPCWYGDSTDATMLVSTGIDTSEFGDGPDAEDYDDVEDFLDAWKEFAGGREYTSEEKEEMASGSRRIWERNDHKSVMDAIADSQAESDRLQQEGIQAAIEKLQKEFQDKFLVGLPPTAFPEKWRSVVEDAWASREAYETSPLPPPGFHVERVFNRPKCGLRAVLFVNDETGEAILAFAGTNPTSWQDIQTDARQAAGKPTAAYAEAVNITKRVYEEYGSKLRLTGHSLGGGEATVGSLLTGRPATGFNPAGIHENTAKRHNTAPLSAAKKTVTAYCVGDDIVTATQDGTGTLLSGAPDTTGRKVLIGPPVEPPTRVIIVPPPGAVTGMIPPAEIPVAHGKVTSHLMDDAVFEAILYTIEQERRNP